MNPWIGVILIGIGTAADVVLTVTHNPVPSVVASVVIAGLGIVQAFGHAQARSAAGSNAPTNFTNGRG
jgi:hypothetical protein